MQGARPLCPHWRRASRYSLSIQLRRRAARGPCFRSHGAQTEAGWQAQTLSRRGQGGARDRGGERHLSQRRLEVERKKLGRVEEDICDAET